MIRKINLQQAFDTFDTLWEPRVAAAVDDHDVKLAKLEGEFHWHAHHDADELFYVIAGELRIELPDGHVVLEAGELAVVPAGVEHRPIASTGCQVMLLERRGTVNTGDAKGVAGTTGLPLGQ